MTRIDALRALYEAVKAGASEDDVAVLARAALGSELVSAGLMRLPPYALVRWACDPRDPELRAMGAALALHEAVLPGWTWCSEIGPSGPHDGYMSPPFSPDGITAQADTPARAWLLAILAALIDQAEKAGKGE